MYYGTKSTGAYCFTYLKLYVSVPIFSSFGSKNSGGTCVCVKATAYKVSVTFAAPSPVTMHVVLSITTTIPSPS